MGWVAVGVAGSFGSDKAMQFGGRGARRNDPTHNNAFKLADMMDQARGREIEIGPGNWAFAPMSPAAYSVGGQPCIAPPSGTVLRGVPWRTVLQRYVYGIKDPTTNWEIWSPAATFPGGWTANHLYTAPQSIIVNGHRYVTLTGGTSGATIPPTLGTIVNTVVDNTVTWILSDRIWRGPLIDVSSKSNVLLYGLVLDGIAGREDAAYPIATTIPTLMGGGYNDVTTGSGWDSTSQIVAGAGLVEEFEINTCWVKRARGENIYMGGATPGHVRILNCVISDGNADGISSTSTMTAVGNRIYHVSQAVESFGSTLTEYYGNNWVDDCYNGIIVGNSAGIVSTATQRVHENRVKAYSIGIWFIGPVPGRSAIDGRITQNTTIDCATGIFLEGFGSNIEQVQVLFNKIVCDTRGPIGGMSIGSALDMIDVTVQGNACFRTANAVTNGFTFSDGINSSVQGAGSKRVRYLDNTIIGKINTGGAVASADFSGLWRGNNYDQVDIAGDFETVSSAGTQDIHPHNEHTYPECDTNNTIGLLGTIANATKFEDRQVVQIHCRTGTKPVLVPQTGATHKMPAPRITHPNVDFRVRLDGGIWVLEKYDLIAGTNAGKPPVANDVAPSFFNMSAGGNLETFGLTELTVAPSGAVNWDGVSNPPIGIIRVRHNGGNNTFRHNTGAGIKLFLHGAANYTPAAAGVIDFEYDGTQATEYRRREGATSWA